MIKGQTNRLLGYPQDARLLILNADDFGVCHAVNEAIIGVLKAGLIRSTTLMVPCPWVPQAMRFLREHPEVPFGVHLTAISDFTGYRWKPFLPREKVPSLVDPLGYFHNFDDMFALLPHIALDELEMEFRAQIEFVLAARLQPTHLDWHALRINKRPEVADVLIRLAKEFGLALRVRGQAMINSLQAQGLPTNDTDFLDSYLLEPQTKHAQFAQLLRELPEGLSEWAIHPGLEHPELLALDPTGRHERQLDYDFWTSPEAKEIIRQEGIVLLDYRPLQALWQGIGAR